MPKSRFVVYEEVIRFPIWASLLLWGVVGCATVPSALTLRRLVGSGAEFPVAILVAATIPPLVAFLILGLFGRLTVQVRRTSIRLAFGYLPIIEKVVLFEDIDEIEVVRYHPIREFGGWGIRGAWGGGKTAWTLGGDQALVLTLHDGHRLYVGSEYPERLKTSLRGVWRANPKTGENA